MAAAETKLVALPTGGNATAREARLMGAVLVDAGRLKTEDAERILRLQREENMRFGDAAIKLGLVRPADIHFALSRQFDFSYLERGQSAVSEELVAAYAPFGPEAEAIRALRSQLALRWLDGEPPLKALAVVSSERGDGRSYIAANLATSFSQMGRRTLLIDADMRNPRQHEIFALDNRVGLSAVLAGRCGSEAVQAVPALANLSVLTAGARPPNPQELLARPAFSHLLQQLSPQLDVVVLDTPAATDTADAQIVAVRSGSALIVARKDAARKWRVQGVSDRVTQGKALIIGAVLNSH